MLTLVCARKECFREKLHKLFVELPTILLLRYVDIILFSTMEIHLSCLVDNKVVFYNFIQFYSHNIREYHTEEAYSVGESFVSS